MTDEADDTLAKTKREVSRAEDATAEKQEEESEHAEGAIDVAAKSQEETENSIMPENKPDGWKANFQNVLNVAKAARDGTEDDEEGGKPESVERQEKIHATVVRAHAMVKKFKVLNEMTKKEAADAAAKRASDGDGVTEEMNKMHGEDLAKKADAASVAAAHAAQSVKDLQGQYDTAVANGAANAATLLQQLTSAQTAEAEARKTAEEHVDAAKQAEMQGGSDGQAAAAQAEQSAEDARLKAEQEKAEADLKAETAFANSAEAAAEGDKAHAQAAGQQAAAAASAAASVDVSERTRTAQAHAAAAALAKHKESAENIPEVKAITPNSVQQIAREHIKSMISNTPSAQ